MPVSRSRVQPEQAELSAHSRELLAALVASSSDAIITKTLEGTVTSWNPAAEHIFGYRADEMIGQSIQLLLPPDRISEEQSILSQIRQGARVEHFETMRVCKSGIRIAVSVTVSPILDGQGKVIGASKIARDITEKHRAEEELRAYRNQLQRQISATTGELSAIVQTAANAIITTDGEGRIDVFNPAAEEMFGWSYAEIHGNSVACLLPEGEGQAHQKYFRMTDAALRYRSIGIKREVRARRRNGETFPVSIALGNTKLGPDQPYFVAFITDITAQRTIEEDLRRAKEQAEAAARAKASFLANMSHEIRTPMNAIIGFSELVLADGSVAGAAREHVQTVHQSARDLLLVINDILDYSKIEGGKTDLERLPFSLTRLLRDVLKLLDQDARRKQLAVHVDLAPNVPAVCLGDPTRIRQILLNLVGNAIKFTHAGGITLQLKALDDGQIHFAVRDTGIGMTPEQLDKVFESFTQADVSTTRRFGGTGLGTTICRHLVELMHGKIWADSTYGQGSTFHFTLPLPAIHSTSAEVLLPTDENDLSASAPRAFRILLAEDVAANARLLMLRLAQIGHQVVWQDSGHRAVDACIREDFDVVLMDVMMPDMDGMEATRAIRMMRATQAPHLPIIALTASVLPEDRRRCLEAGMDIVLGKPIDLGEILQQMERLVPVGRGHFNATVASDTSVELPATLAPLAQFANLPRALRLWGDAEVYRLALVEFCTAHGKDGGRIAAQLEPSPELARRMAHTLKGVAANLQLGELAQLAAYVDRAVKSGDLAEARLQAQQLQHEFDRLLALVASTHSAPASSEPALTAPSQQEIPQLLQALRDGLATYNPDNVSGLLPQLALLLGSEQVQAIFIAVQHFDFDLALSLVDSLILHTQNRH
ncbi:PAS domain S-box protein [Duganella qianjiadongensis]|uniref:histidine kinase n=1 Tax=Duganella qianjiadongensis TaxID=2692176 RepID=A0ABW9VJA7_9BURK|nr:PAS domain S-box protein [Duganella qianjiadongensis]MYM39689.1 PAS domain S-box protein [Duganella qianjiadongensis]